jgi:hypothetical protein
MAAAGIFISKENGILTPLYPHLGHYRPGEAHMQRVLFFLYHKGVNLRTFEMDTQQILHVARDATKEAVSKEKDGGTDTNTIKDNGKDHPEAKTEKRKRLSHCT